MQKEMFKKMDNNMARTICILQKVNFNEGSSFAKNICIFVRLIIL